LSSAGGLRRERDAAISRTGASRADRHAAPRASLAVPLGRPVAATKGHESSVLSAMAWKLTSADPTLPRTQELLVEPGAVRTGHLVDNCLVRAQHLRNLSRRQALEVDEREDDLLAPW